MPVCGGWAFCVAVRIAKTSVRPLALPIPSKDILASSPPFAIGSPFPKRKPAPKDHRSKVAGCATGSARPVSAQIDTRAGL
jgi:hypothetical protein